MSRVRTIHERLDGIIRVGVAQVLVLTEASVTYELTFLNRDGTQAGGWRVLGTSQVGNSAQRNLELAVPMAAAKVARDLDQQVAIRAWLERHSSSGTEPSSDG